MRSPSVARVEFACVALVWRFTAGTPRRSSRSHFCAPVFLSRQTTFHAFSVVSFTGAMSP